MTTPDWVPQLFNQSFCSGELYFLDNKTEPIKAWKRIIEKHIKKLPEGSLNIHARELAGMNKAYWS